MRLVISVLAVAAVLLAAPSASALAAHPIGGYDPAPRGAISAPLLSATTAGASPTTTSSTPTPAPQSQLDCDDPKSVARDPYGYLLCPPETQRWDPTEWTGDVSPELAAGPESDPRRPNVPLHVDDALAPSWQTLTAIGTPEVEGDWTGYSYRSIIERTGVRLVAGSLPNNTWGAYNPAGNVVIINNRALREDPRALAAVLAHELTHVRQWADGDRHRSGCIKREADSIAAEARVWGTFWEDWGPGTTRLERDLSAKLQILEQEGVPGLTKLVVDNPGYQENCDLWTP